MSLMPPRPLLVLALPLALLSAGCGGSPTQAEGTVSVTNTTSTTTSTSTSTTTTVIPTLTGGTVTTSPAGGGVAWATVFSFAFAPSGGVPPYMYTWNFGDGGTGTGATASHQYNNTGSFLATVIAADSRGIAVQGSTSILVDNVSGRWVVTFANGILMPQAVDLVQNQTAVSATIRDTANGFGFASGSGNVSNPRLLSVSATFNAGTSSAFAITFVGKVNDKLTDWNGDVSGITNCPCSFSAVRQ
jgi:PKD domain